MPRRTTTTVAPCLVVCTSPSRRSTRRVGVQHEPQLAWARGGALRRRLELGSSASCHSPHWFWQGPTLRCCSHTQTDACSEVPSEIWKRDSFGLAGMEKDNRLHGSASTHPAQTPCADERGAHTACFDRNLAVAHGSSNESGLTQCAEGQVAHKTCVCSRERCIPREHHRLAPFVSLAVLQLAQQQPARDPLVW